MSSPCWWCPSGGSPSKRLSTLRACSSSCTRTPPRRRLRRGAGAEPLRRVLLPGPGVRRSELRGPSGRDRRAGVDPRTRRVPRGWPPRACSSRSRPPTESSVWGCSASWPGRRWRSWDVRDRSCSTGCSRRVTRSARARRSSECGSSPRRFWAATRSPTSAGWRGSVPAATSRGSGFSSLVAYLLRDSQVTVGEAAPGRVRIASRG